MVAIRSVWYEKILDAYVVFFHLVDKLLSCWILGHDVASFNSDGAYVPVNSVP